MQERLDGFLANTPWLEHYPTTQVLHLFSSISDHRPILLGTTMGNSSNGMENKEKPFRFEKAWIGESGCEQHILEAWNTYFEEDGVSKVARKIACG